MRFSRRAMRIDADQCPRRSAAYGRITAKGRPMRRSKSMLDEPRARNNGKLTAPAAAKGKAVAEARAARTLERAKAPRVAPPPPPSRAAAMPPNFRKLDRLSRALLARATQGISPVAVAETWVDWALHLGAAPGKRLELLQLGAISMAQFALWLPKAAGARSATRRLRPLPATGDFLIRRGCSRRSTSSRKPFSQPRPGGRRRQTKFPDSNPIARRKSRS